ncbi:MAG: hypothetical protein ACRDHE_09145 [Ktedonobacterales bacterium]
MRIHARIHARIHGGSRGLALSALLALTAVGLVACGQTTTGGLGGQSQGSHEPTATSSGGAVSSGATPTSTGTGATSSPIAPTPGQVTVSLVGPARGAASVATSETINVEIANGLSSTITTTDHHTDCMMVTLEQQVSGAWQPVGRCLIMAATRMIPIAGGQTVKQILTPQNGLTSHTWPAGTYRVAFSYSVGPETTTPGAGATVYSATFTIG